MTQVVEETMVDIKTVLWQVIEELPTERVAEVLDFALFIQTRPARKPLAPHRTKAQLEAMRQLRGSAQGEHLLERLLAERAKDREREQ